jgi:hypothetical protein
LKKEKKAKGGFLDRHTAGKRTLHNVPWEPQPWREAKDGGRDLSAQSLSSHITWTEHQPAEEKNFKRKSSRPFFYFFLFINFFQATKNWTKNILLFFPSSRQQQQPLYLSIYLSLLPNLFLVAFSFQMGRWGGKRRGGGAIFSRWIFFLIFHSDLSLLRLLELPKKMPGTFSDGKRAGDAPPSSRPGQTGHGRGADEFFREITGLNSFTKENRDCGG